MDKIYACSSLIEQFPKEIEYADEFEVVFDDERGIMATMFKRGLKREFMWLEDDGKWMRYEEDRYI